MKDLHRKFAEIETRVKALIAENATLRERAAALERELTAAREEAREFESLNGAKLHIREKVESALKALEAVSKRDGG